MGILPVSLSLMATLLSAVMVLGVPAEVYYNGTIYWIILFSNIIVYPLAAHAFLPVYHNLGLTSCYQVMILFISGIYRYHILSNLLRQHVYAKYYELRLLKCNFQINKNCILANLSQRLTEELLAYHCPRVHPSIVVVSP